MKALKNFVAGILLFGTLHGCPSTSSKPLPQPAVIVDTNECGPACVHLMELGCEEGLPVEVPADGGGTRLASCGEVCKNTQDHGVWLNPKCVQTIKSCADVESCAVFPKTNGDSK